MRGLWRNAPWPRHKSGTSGVSSDPPWTLGPRGHPVRSERGGVPTARTSADRVRHHGRLEPPSRAVEARVYLADAYRLAERFEEAETTVRAVLSLTREGGMRGYEAYALRLLAESRQSAILQRLKTPQEPTGRPSRSPKIAVCAPSSPTATSASASSTGAPGTARRPRAPDHRDDDVPRDGHDLLAGEGGRGAGWSRAMTRVCVGGHADPHPPRRAARRRDAVGGEGHPASVLSLTLVDNA